MQVIGLKVKYDEQVLREAEHSPQRTEELRQETYEAAKKKLLQALLALEREFPGSKTIMAGGCTLCRTCARVQGEPCRYPEKMRYSYSGLGFDLGRISEELLGMPLLVAEKRPAGIHRCNCLISAQLMPGAKDRRLFVNLASEL